MGIEAELGRATIAIRATLDKLDGDLAEARGKTDSAIERIVGGAGKAFQGLGTAALGGIAMATGAVLGLGAALAKITIDAAPVEGISQAFDGLAESAGIGTDEMLAALKRGSAGMVSNRDLMLSFNKAAALVSTDFAVQLPDAMGYLGKVSAATGQDMGFMLDSLVKGVGRLSPMILDNLGIQVTLAEATDRAATMYGVEAGALDKTQLQAGMMNVVLEKLAANTASMPEVTESAAAKMARFRAEIQDTKDSMGMALLPAFENVMGAGTKLADIVLPLLTDFLENTLAPAVQTISGVINDFFMLLQGGDSPLEALRGALEMAFGEEVAGRIMAVVDGIVQFGEKVAEFLAPVLDWISKNVELKDVLFVLGAAIASVVLPALWSVIAAVAPIIAVFVAAVAIVALLRQAWETDWMGIRTALTDAWNNVILPALATLWEWLKVNVPAAIATLKDFWTNVLLPAIQTVWNWVQNTAFPIIEKLWEWLEVNVPAAIQTLKDFWTNTLLPAITAVWAFIQDHVVPLFEALADVAEAVLGKAIEALAGLWQNVLKPALDKVWGFIQDSVIPVFEKIAKTIRETVGPILEKLGNTILPVISAAFDAIGKAIDKVIGWLKKVADKFNAIELPWWLQPGSPTPLELGLTGIGQAMRGLAQMELPRLSAELRGVYEVEPGGRGGGGLGGQQVVIYGLTVEGVQDVGGLLGQLQALA